MVRILRHCLSMSLVLLAASSGYAQPGTVDAGFGGSGFVFTDIDGNNEFARAIGRQADGKLVVAGFRTLVGSGAADIVLARYSADGILDDTFGNGGIVVTDLGTTGEEARALAFQPDGKIIVAGVAGPALSYDPVVLRYDADGTLDPTFGTNGVVSYSTGGFGNCTGVALRSDGKILIAGDTFVGQGVLLRFTVDGVLDASFASGGITPTQFGTYSALLVQSDDRIVAVRQNVGDVYVDRYTEDGALDATFGTGGTTVTDFGGDDRILALTAQADGGIVAAGESRDLLFETTSVIVARYSSEGVPDPGFGDQGHLVTDVSVGANDGAAAVVQDADGKLLVAGTAFVGIGTRDFMLLRYNTDGTLDQGFGTGGILTTSVWTEHFGTGVVVLPGGRIVLAGYCDTPSNFDFTLVGCQGGDANGIQGADHGPLVRAYPMPCSDELTLEGLRGGSSYTISDMSGRVVLTGSTLAQRTHIGTAALAPGLYAITLREAGSSQSVRMVKR